MHGSRAREFLREAVRRRECSTANALEQVKRAYVAVCTKRKMIPQMEEQLGDLRRRMKECRGPGAIKTYLELKNEAEVLERSIKEIDEGQEATAFFERARPLLVSSDEPQLDVNLEQKREALAMSLFHSEKSVPVFIQTDRCTHCGHDWEMRTDESLMVCPNEECQRVSRFLQLSTDHVDMDYVAQDTHANHTRSTATGNVGNTQHNDDFPKRTLYEKFLMQFSSKVAEVPDHVKEIILRELSTLHIQHGSKVQPTPIGNILRKHNLKAWTCMSVRIGIMLKRKDDEPMPVFSDALLERLMARWDALLDTLKRNKCRNRKKVFNFKFLTKVFLTMEGEYALAELFENHKTRAVLRREDRRVAEASALLQKANADRTEALKQEVAENGFQWEHFRSL